jgi:hypothetical protein
VSGKIRERLQCAIAAGGLTAQRFHWIVRFMVCYTTGHIARINASQLMSKNEPQTGRVYQYEVGESRGDERNEGKIERHL